MHNKKRLVLYSLIIFILVGLGIYVFLSINKQQVNDLSDGEVRCGGWDTYGEVLCECDGLVGKIDCPKYSMCSGEAYTCSGTCGQCKCYKGDIEEECNGRDLLFK